MMTRPTDHVLAIDVVRLGCAMLVLTMHYTALLPFTLPLPRDWTGWTWAGWVGVEIFFVVSGFVIAASIECGAARDFLRRRVLRLAPAAWLCATLTAMIVLGAGLAGWETAVPQWLVAVTFWPFGLAIDGGYWTLGIEVSFYLVAAATLDPAAPQRSIERVGAALAVISAMFWCWHGTDAMQTNRVVDLLLLSHGGLFAVGIALHGIRTGGPTATRFAMLSIGLAAGGAEIVAASHDMAVGVAATNGPWLPLSIFAVGVTAIAAADRLQPWLAWIGPRRLAFVGLMTYPLYLSHLRIARVVLAWLLAFGIPATVALAFMIALALGLAAMIAAYAEPALRRLLVRALDRADRVSRRVPAPDRHRSASLPIG